MSTVYYNSEDLLPLRFFNHARMALRKDLPGHEWKDKRYIERAGDVLLWSMESLPKVIWEKFKDPRIVTIVLTKFALLSNSYLFYPALTRKYAEKVITTLLIEPWRIKFAAYVYTCSLIIGAASRAYGRLSNESLMKSFYRDQVETD